MIRRNLFRFCAAQDQATGRPRRKIQVAIVGSGPSGCYVAHQLLKRSEDIHVDVFERMPVPYGLSRYGVAPDHPEVKNVENTFTEMFESYRASFMGNIEVGKEITMEQLLSAYAAVVVATGCDGDMKLGIKGERLTNILSARELVNYYNTMPEPFSRPKVSPLGDPSKTKSVVIIGNGNVALDCARVLGASYKKFCPTDMNCFAVKTLSEMSVNNISVVARRGVEHSAFTTKEFRELTNLGPFTRVLVDPFNLEEKAKENAHVQGMKRKLELLSKHQGAWNLPVLEGDPTRCTIAFRYHLKPVEFLAKGRDRHVVGGVRFEVTDPSVPKEEKPESIVIPCDLVLRSIGYRNQGIRGVPFDNLTCRIPHDGKGRIDGVSRLYCSGWAKRGPKGVILQTLNDAKETVDTIMDDLTAAGCFSSEAPSIPSCSNQGKFDLIERMAEAQIYPVLLSAVKRIWKQERERGIDLGKSAEKVPTCRDMIDMAMAGKIGRKAADRVRGFAGARPPGFELLDDWLDDETMLLDMGSGQAKRLEITKESPSYKKY